MELINEFRIPEDYKSDEKITFREACRAVVFDENNLMPVLFVAKENYHKLPGGGIDLGEDKVTALIRELQEETGCEAEITKEIGMVIESNSTRKQTSYCYMGNIVKKSEHNFTEREKAKGFILQRVTVDEAIRLIQADKPESPTGERIQERDLCILRKAKEVG